MDVEIDVNCKLIAGHVRLPLRDGTMTGIPKIVKHSHGEAAEEMRINIQLMHIKLRKYLSVISR